ncbi:hypothetical protein ZOSMA_11G00510 [Zostera marina]|uniref:Uncharacterized protein n=1 Tax=Zostera marina TaxID=29655 RepID=A0A0K9Q3J2_ZOSMR|nr:hypothetical protein ZOSMA_11G00510 [Zostera marina]
MKAFSSSSSSSSSSYYKLVMVSGEISNSLSLHVYDSRNEGWENVILSRKPSVSPPESELTYTDTNEVMYFLSKSGEVVSTQMQRSPCKQFSSVITVEEGTLEEAMIYFLSPSGAVVGCHLTQSTIQWPNCQILILNE